MIAARQVLDENQPMISPYVPRYQHVARLGNSEVEGLLDKPVIIQEKIDGANLTVSLDPGGFLTICSRRKVIFDHGAQYDSFNGACEYVVAHKGIKTLLERNPKWILRGDWLTHHTVRYNEDAYGKFYVFDIQEENGVYIPVGVYAPVLDELGIPMAKLLFSGQADLAKIQEIAGQQSEYGENKREGVVVKRYDYVNKYGRSTWGKFVNAEYSADQSVKKYSVRSDDPQEIKFVAENVTAALIAKVIGFIQVRDEERVTSENMGEVIGRCWHDAVEDGIFDFITKNRVQKFDFASARRLTQDKVRTVVLAYCDGSLDLEKVEDWEAVLVPDKPGEPQEDAEEEVAEEG